MFTETPLRPAWRALNIFCAIDNKTPYPKLPKFLLSVLVPSLSPAPSGRGREEKAARAAWRGTPKPHVMPTPFPPYNPTEGLEVLRSCPHPGNPSDGGTGDARRVIPLS